MSNVGPNTGNVEDQSQPNQKVSQTPNDPVQPGARQPVNNAPNNDDNFEDMWQDNPVEQAQTQTPQSPAPVQQQAPNAEEAFGTYIDGLELTRGVDLDAISGELSQGSTEGLSKAFNVVAAKVYRQSMIDMNKIIEQKVNAGVAAAVQQSSNAAKGNNAVRQMNEALNFTSNPAIAPIANAALAQFIKKGKTPEDAVESVRKFFQNTSRLSAKDLGLQSAPRSRPGNQPFSGAGDISGEDDEEINWLEMLGVASPDGG